jgi:hypothetical protein
LAKQPVGRCTPEFDIGARRWLAKTAKKNLWRVATWYGLDDLISDGLVCWQVVLRKYPKVRERRHLMALFQRTYINHLHALANKRSAQAEEVHCEQMPEQAYVNSDIDMLHLVYSAPETVRKFLIAVIRQPNVLNNPRRHRLHGRPQTLNEFLCAIAKVDPEEHNLDARLQALLKS